MVTFLLTDIEASVELWEADHDAMAAALELHDELVGRGVEAHAGRVLKAKGEGDSTLSVFPRASDAVGCAAELRESLATAAWPGGLDLRVRIALHTGEAQERGGDYYGPALNRAARLRALAAGGVTLLSQATTEIVHDRVPAGTELVDLGSHELRGLSRPERVFELRAQGAAGATGLPAPAQEIRKTVTVAFVCLSEAGAAGEELDAEARRRVSSHALASARTILERHGASVADYPGDVLMAVFGVPLLHEDDAVRAVRSGLELRQTLPGVTAQFAPALEVELAAQVGIATGEVIAGGTPGLASGPAVTTAKRLEELAAPGDIVVDRSTERLVRESVSTEPAPFAGGDEPDAFVRRGASPPRDAPARPRVAARGTRPAAGRALGRLRGGGEHSHLPPRDRPRRRRASGSRASWTSSRAGSATRRRCSAVAASPTARASPTGRSASWSATWRATRAATPRRRCAARSRPSWRTIRKAESVADALEDAIGLGGPGGAGTEKIFWAARRLFEVLAQRRPLVVVLDDLQWAEATFLDLVEHVADLARDAPIVLLCLARPELLDGRSGWGGGKLNAASILLEPLTPEESTRARRQPGRHPAPRMPRSASPRPARATRCSPRSCSRS